LWKNTGDVLDNRLQSGEQTSVWGTDMLAAVIWWENYCSPIHLLAYILTFFVECEKNRIIIYICSNKGSLHEDFYLFFISYDQDLINVSQSIYNIWVNNITRMIADIFFTLLYFPSCWSRSLTILLDRWCLLDKIYVDRLSTDNACCHNTIALDVICSSTRLDRPSDFGTLLLMVWNTQ